MCVCVCVCVCIVCVHMCICLCMYRMCVVFTNVCGSGCGGGGGHVCKAVYLVSVCARCTDIHCKLFQGQFLNPIQYFKYSNQYFAGGTPPLSPTSTAEGVAGNTFTAHLTQHRMLLGCKWLYPGLLDE